MFFDLNTDFIIESILIQNRLDLQWLFLTVKYTKVKLKNLYIQHTCKAKTKKFRT